MQRPITNLQLSIDSLVGSLSSTAKEKSSNAPLVSSDGASADMPEVRR
jgi:hypothetical protein